MTHHSELLNYMAGKINAQSYLEIGIFDPEHNFYKINVASKEGCDPAATNEWAGVQKMTSDEFFAHQKLYRPLHKYDIALIDGLHHANQVQKDITNAYNCLNDNGAIVIHDTNPYSQHITCVPRGTQREWSGDVYKIICQIISPKFTIDFDYGCTIIVKNGELKWNKWRYTWQQFAQNRKRLLNLVSVEQGLKMIQEFKPVHIQAKGVNV